MKQYRHAMWIQFREDVIKLHGCRCSHCGRSRADGVVIQVHHKLYIKDRLPWEYGFSDCEALCKGCHAIVHGHVMPREGWIWIGVDDLGDLNGNCELCGTDIRYVYAIEHPNWGPMAVGTVCCDKLTGTMSASDHLERHLKSTEALKRFVSSSRWRELPNEGLAIKQKGIRVVLRDAGGAIRISMDGFVGKGRFESILDAKMRVFETISSGEAQRFLKRRRQIEQDALIEALSNGYHM